MRNRYSSFTPNWGITSLLALIVISLSFPLSAQKNKPSVSHFEHLRNGTVATPEDPASWTTGNTGSSNAHHAELMSAPYRMVLNNITPSKSVMVRIEYDILNSDKLALDYLTSYDRLEPHVATFGHGKEEVNPTVGTPLFQPDPATPDQLFPIPAPSVTNSPIAGLPVTSFNNVSGAGQAQMAIWNGTITDISYVGPTPDLSSSANQSQQVEITFTPGIDASQTVILAWGGHIAGRDEWGFLANGDPRSAGGISGSPYHMRMVDWSFGNLGNKDLSMSIDLVSEPDIPDTPGNFTATPVSTNQIDLSWEAVSSSIVVNYLVERSLKDANTWTEVASLAQSTTSFSDMDLEVFTAYDYRVSARNTDGSSSFAFTQATTLNPITTVFDLGGKTYQKLELALEALILGVPPSDIVYQFNDNGEVLVHVYAFLTPNNTIASVVDLLQNKYNVTDFILEPQAYIDNNIIDIDCYINKSFLSLLNDEEDINHVDSGYRASNNNSALGETGVITQVDQVQTTKEIRESFQVARPNLETGDLEVFPIDATGVNVGIISNGLNTRGTYNTDQLDLDLPGPLNPNRPTPVEILEDSPFIETDEGNAMAQKFHDFAPGGRLLFHHAPTKNKYWEAIRELSDAGAQIIIDDYTYFFEESFKGPTPINDAIDAHVAKEPGNAVYSSSGNFADRCFQDTFAPIPVPDGTIYETGTEAWMHQEKIRINVKPGGEYLIAFYWDEKPTVSDWDIFVTDASLNRITGNNYNSPGKKSNELLAIKTSVEQEAFLVLSSEGATMPAPAAFRVIAFIVNRDDGSVGLEFPDGISGPTTHGHTMNDNVVSVGASDYRSYTTGNNQAFSSHGGLLPNGDNSAVTFMAADGGNTGSLTIGNDIAADEDDFLNFFGTSASVVAAAAAHALYLQIAEDYHPDGIPAEIFSDPTYLPGNPGNDIIELTKQTAIPPTNPAPGGSGSIRPVEAWKLFASQTPLISGATGEEGKVISAEEVLVTMIGNWFTPESQALLDGVEIPTTFISETELQALVPAFSGQGKLVVVANEPSTPTGADYPVSDGFDLLDGRRVLQVIAPDVSIIFGQEYSAGLTPSIEGLSEGETWESLGLPAIELNPTAMGIYPFVDFYTIFPALAEPLTPEQESEFIINLTPGVLSITRRDMTIQPQDITEVYGVIPEVIMNYTTDPTDVADFDDFLSTIRSEHLSTYLLEDDGNGNLVNRVSAVINRLSAVINENPGQVDELLSLINNSNWVATKTSLENRVSAVVNDSKLIEFDGDQLFDYLDTPEAGNSAGIENRLSAVVNGSSLVNGESSIYDPAENRLSAIVNRLSAVVNRLSAVVNVPLGDEEDQTDYSELLAIVDIEDGSPDGTDPDALPPLEVYSVNVFTGNTPSEESHYIMPGAPLSPFLSFNFNNTLQTGRYSVLPKPITIDLEDGEEEPFVINYVESQPAYTSTIEPGLAFDDEATIEYSLNPAADPPGVGEYAIIPTATITDPDSNDHTPFYDITTIDGSLVVTPGELTIDTDDLLLNAGDAIDDYELTSTITGDLREGETFSDIFSGDPMFTYSSAEYEAAGRATGSYPLITEVFPDPDNYALVDNGALVLANSTEGKKIRVFFDCYVQNPAGSDYGYTAYLRYENDNPFHMWLGPEFNYVEGTDFNASDLPFEFLPGSNQVTVEFNGRFRWFVSTFGSANPSSVEVNADNLNNNQRCKAKDINANSRIANPDPEIASNSLDSGELIFYPNPIEDYMMLRVNKTFTHHDYELYDSQGIRHSINADIDPIQSVAKFDFSNFNTGLYLLKVNMEGTTSTIRILRQ